MRSPPGDGSLYHSRVAGFIPEDKLEQIRNASDVVDVIGGYFPLKRAGGNFTALCPFHREKSASFHVNPSRQTFHCFGCHKGGDVFTFVREYENLSFIEAVKRLADRASILLEFDASPEQQQARGVKEELRNIHEQITKRWQSALQNDAAGQIARDYLAQRGISQEAVELFRLGFAPDLWDDTVNWAKAQKHDFDHMQQAGLIINKEGTDRYYDRFRGRLIFPICDEQGRVIGFSGRILTGDERTAKYVNSPETPLFTKGKVIYGLDKSKRALLEAKSAIVCEGQIDLITCFMAGVKNVVAPQGTALTSDQARILKRYADEIVLCFDSDTAGQNAAIRSLDHLLPAGFAIRVATVPAPHDPDSYIKKLGADAFQTLIDDAEGFFDFYLNQLCKTHDLAADLGRSTVVKAMGEALRKTGNSVLIDRYAQQTALRVGVSPDAMRSEFKKAPKTRPQRQWEEESFDASEPQEPEIPRPSPKEFWLLKILLISEEAALQYAPYINLQWLTHPHVRQIVELALKAHKNETWRGPAPLLSALDDARAQSLASEALAEQRDIPDHKAQIGDILLTLRNQFIDRELASLTHILSQPDTPDEKQNEIIRLQQDWKKMKRDPLIPPTPE